MILRYEGCPEPKEDNHFYEYPGMVVGHAYDVAEILEEPWKLMVREPGAPSWPAPVDIGFCVDPEWFEVTDQVIPIVSCGLRHDHYFRWAFGVLVRGSAHVEKLRRLKELERAYHDLDSDVPAWKERVAAEFNAEIARALHAFIELPIPCDFTVCDDVYWSDDSELRPSFGFVGSDLPTMARMEVSKALVGRCVKEFLHALGIDAPEAAEVSVDIWQGTPGCERLLNPPPDGGLEYRARR